LVRVRLGVGYELAWVRVNRHPLDLVLDIIIVIIIIMTHEVRSLLVLSFLHFHSYQ